MASSLHYKQLDECSSEFRLLTIIPSPDETAPVSCVLKTYSLADSPPFHALSYVWGDPKVTADIYINGSTFKATRNLEHALRAIRLRLKDPKDPITSSLEDLTSGSWDGTFRVWADAIVSTRLMLLSAMLRFYVCAIFTPSPLRRLPGLDCLLIEVTSASA